MRSEGKGRKPDHVESHLHLIFSTSLLTHGEARATSKDANTVIQVRQDVGLPQDASSGGAERSDRGYIVKVEVTNFLIDQIWAVREREASRLTPNGLGPATGRIELTLIQFFKRQEFKSFMEGIPGAQVCVCCIPDTY